MQITMCKNTDIHIGSLALLWQNAKCKSKFANKCVQANAHRWKWLSPGFTLHFAFRQSKATCNITILPSHLQAVLWYYSMVVLPVRKCLYFETIQFPKVNFFSKQWRFTSLLLSIQQFNRIDRVGENACILSANFVLLFFKVTQWARTRG